MDTGRITLVLGGLGVLALVIIFLPRPAWATILTLIVALIVVRYVFDAGGPDHLREGSRGRPR